jgi:hypothetical protein
VTFEEMFLHVADGGVYIIEDTHTSYWGAFGGGPEAGRGTAIGAVKSLIDDLHAWHYQEEEEVGPGDVSRLAYVCVVVGCLGPRVWGRLLDC